jgi:hypothetical protein
MSDGLTFMAKTAKVKVNTSLLKSKTKNSELSGLKSIGAFTRKVAQRSMKKRNKPSAPGQPPSVHSGALKKGIVFAVDKAKSSVVIGALKIETRNGKRFYSQEQKPVPATLEHGGVLPERKNSRRRMRKVGGAGEIRIDGGSGAKMVKDLHGKKRAVVYSKLKTSLQASRANRLNEELYGPARLKSGHVAARPYMKPADEVTRKQMIPGAFAGTFK